MIDKSEVFKEILESIYSHNAIEFEEMSSHYKNSINNSSTILLNYRSAESTGGSCYGSYTSRYDRSDREREEDLADNFGFLYDFVEKMQSPDYTDKSLKDFKEKWARAKVNDYVTDYQTGQDYYGNYSEYQVVAIDIVELFQDLLTTRDFEIFKETFERKQKRQAKNDLEQKNRQDYQQVMTQIESFDNQQTDEHKGLINRISQMEKQLEQAKAQLDKFQATGNKKLKSLKSQQAVLEQFFADNHIDLAAEKKKEDAKKKNRGY